MRIRPSELSRRAVLSGLAAATASGLAQPALAIGPMANVQVPAAYRFKLGGFECTVVSDGPLKLGTFSAEMFKGISQERIDEILAANFLDKTDITVNKNALAFNTGVKLVSSIKTSRFGSSLGCCFCKALRAAATSGRSCSAARRLFLKRKFKWCRNREIDD